MMQLPPPKIMEELDNFAPGGGEEEERVAETEGQLGNAIDERRKERNGKRKRRGRRRRKLRSVGG